MKNIKYTEEYLRELASKYSKAKDLAKDNPYAYRLMYKKGILYEIFPNPRKWNEKLIKEALIKCGNLNNLMQEYPGAYMAAKRLNILKQLYKDKSNSERKKWNKKNILEAHSESMTKKEFIKKFPGAYYAAKRLEIFSNLKFKECGNIKSRCIYSIEFEDNYVYVGLTFNFDQRIYKHFNDRSKSSAAREHFLKTNSKYKVIKLTDYIESKKASVMEGEFIDKYLDNKWNILNIAKAGGLGGNYFKWSKTKVLKIVKKYKNNKELMNSEDRGAYYHATTHEYIQELVYSEKPFKYTKKDALKIALKYKRATELLSSKDKGYYNHASKNGYLKEFKYKD